jgi:hypothetical protein
MDGTCSTDAGDKGIHKKFGSEDLKGKDHLENRGVYKKIKLR